MKAARFEQLLTVLTEIRDDQRKFLELLQSPAPPPPHVHAPADGLPHRGFWICKCGYVHDEEAIQGRVESLARIESRVD